MTTNKTQTYTRLLDKAAPDLTPDLLRKMQFGKMMTPIKVTVSGLTATATPEVQNKTILRRAAESAAVTKARRAVGQFFGIVGQFFGIED